jgi:3-oxoacyl-[acyl-carrier protein] reductase
MARISQLSRSLDGRRVIVTGAASGMGRATACLFADEGAKVVVADWDSDGVNRVVSEIDSMYPDGRAVGISIDVSKNDDLVALVQKCVQSFEGVDVLINNAGISRPTSVFASSERFDNNWDKVLAINLSAHVHLARLCVPYLTNAAGGGRIVNIASTEAIVATTGLAAYTASKHGVVGLTKSLAVELGSHNITVNAICPGPIDTGMTAPIPQEMKDKYAKRKVPLRRYGQPEEVAHMTVSLCMPAASFVNGAALVVDGGMSVKHG